MSQYRQSPLANLTPVVKNLLIINVIFYLATFLLGERFNMVEHFSAFYFNSPLFKPWQIITYMFMHGGFMHILFNMIGLFTIGPILEQTMGSKRFFNYYFICGIGALALHMAVQAFEVHQLTGTFMASHLDITDPAILSKLEAIYYGPVLGASGSIFGILIAFAMIYPDMELMIIPIPIPIKAKYFAVGYIVIELFSGVNPMQANDGVAHFAHLGGALFGFIMIRIWGLHRRDIY
ncbi:rhomboid family intramembrane serine protease [Mucilaginibacter sp. HMF5004]|uniref:rhomboid family intramembrane serine protease n=1 Tax=Mucilaginibacter rivuli TaxID=2857527 RepID=UPI001C5D91A0|nr:rhomboid family intramembrane serine protease [Mucilaginibacter rivuli]MBW4891184.1 rhomboid family intramembrane serine protease [Mucilaginibacter rivuli]